MRAMLCTDWGGPEGLALTDVPEPALDGDDAVRVAVRASGVNFADSLIIQGKYQIKPALPFSPGLEISGQVLETAPGVTRVQPGDRVLGMVDHGGFADQVVTQARNLYRIPDGMSFTDAAAFPVAYGTSHLGLTYKARLQPGETLVVHGAAGGVGLTAVEIGKRLGARVIATAGGAAKLQVAAGAGADAVIDYREEDVRVRIKELTDGRGADVVYDPVGGDLFTASLRSTAPGGRILLVGFASGTVPQIPANILLVKNITAIGYYWGAHRLFDLPAMDASFAELFAWYGAGDLRPHVSNILPLERAAEAIGLLIARKATGKVVVDLTAS
ncbi:MAG: NADPH:quinone oxidoreductase family protein [Rhodobacterales bacterium]|nr:NADPH:quinone oxidoreductase family protein [Rhodobacterales bacterium]